MCIYRMAASRPKPDLRIETSEVGDVYDPFGPLRGDLYQRNENPLFSPGEYYTDDELARVIEENEENLDTNVYNGEQIIHLLKNIITKRLTPVQIENLPGHIKSAFYGYVEALIPFGAPTEHPAVAAGIRTPTPPSSPVEVEDTSGKRKRRKRTVKKKHTKKRVRKRVRKTRKTKSTKRIRRRHN